MKTIAQTLGIKEFPFKIKNKKGNTIYLEDKNGYWEKKEYNLYENEIYYQNSDGEIIDNRFKLEKPPVTESSSPITLQHCIDRGFTVEKIDNPVYKKQNGKDYKLCYLKLSKRHKIDYHVYSGICMILKVDKEDNIIEKKYIRYVNDLDFYIDFLASKKVLHKLYNFKLEALKNSKPLNF